MGSFCLLILLSVCFFAISQSQSQSICDRYSKALGISNLALITVVVNGTENALLGNSTTAPFFNGNRPTGSTDFTKGGAALTALTNGLVTFFGGALGCTDGTILKYTGPALDAIHKPMGITPLVSDTFNQLLVGVTAAKGVVQADQDAITVVLNSVTPLIVFPPTICDKYATLLGITGFQLMAVVVNGTEAGLLGNSTTAPFFNGQTPAGSTDFTRGGPSLAKLTFGLITFFGQFGVLSCTDGTVPKYPDLTLVVIHQPMGITGLVFDTFNQILTGVTAANGVIPADNAQIYAVLETTRTAVVKQATTPGPPPGPPGPPPGSSGITYKVTCEAPPNNCGGGGVYSLTQIVPTQGAILSDPDIQCFDGQVVTFQFPQALPTHPFQIIDNNGNNYPNSPPRMTSSGSVSFTCNAGMKSNPAFYTCTIHGGAPGDPMTGKFILVNAPPGTPPGTPPPGPGQPGQPGQYVPYSGLSGAAVVGILIALFFRPYHYNSCYYFCLC